MHDGGYEYAYNFARDGHPDRDHPTPAKAIVDAGHKLYGIFTFNPGASQKGYLQRLINFAYGMGDVDTQTPTLNTYFTSANTVDDLRDSFDNIFGTIFDSLAYGDVKIVDGLTTDAMTTILVDGQADGLRYKVTDANGNLVYTVAATGNSSNPTVTFTVGGTDYTYAPNASGNAVRKVSTYTYKTTDNNNNQITTTTYTVTENGTTPVVEKRVVVSAHPENNVTTYTTISSNTSASSLDDVRADPNANAVNPKTYYSLTVGGVEYRMALGDIVSTGTDPDPTRRTLTWDLSPMGSLSEGYTYTAEFTVWPNQDAYDYVAGLNNDLDGFEWDYTKETAYPDATNPLYYTGGVAQYPSIVRYPNDVFSVLTNTMQEVNYTVVHSEGSGDVMTTTEDPHTDPLDYPKPMDLTGTEVKVTKEWNDTLDPAPLRRLIESAGFDAQGKPKFHITLKVKRFTPNPQNPEDGTWDSYTSFDFYPRREYDAQAGGYTYVWDPKDLDIAPGIMVSEHPGGAAVYPTTTLNGKTYYILETGHDYKIEEDDFGSYNFEFQATPYHPMLVDGEMKNISLTETPAGSGSTYDYVAEEIVDANTSSSGQSMSTTFAFVGSNNLRSGLNVLKKVLDKDGVEMNSDDTFYVRLYATDKDGNVLTYAPPARQDGQTDAQYAQTLKDYDNNYPIWYKTFSDYTIDAQGNYTGVTHPEVQGDGYSYSWAHGDVKEIKTGQLLQLINIPYGTRIMMVEVEPVKDENGVITDYVDKNVDDTIGEYRMWSITGDLAERADEGTSYTSIGFDHAYDIIFTNRHTKRVGSIVAEKKWLHADGTEYTAAEIAALNPSTQVTGELWRSYPDPNASGSGTSPTVRLMATYNNGAGPVSGPVELWSDQVASGSNLQFSVATSATSNPASYNVSTGAHLVRTYRHKVDAYDGSYTGSKLNATAFTLNNITQNVTVTMNFTQNDPNIGYKILKRTPPAGGSHAEKVGDFSFPSAEGWSKEWTPTDLNEDESREYDYYFQNVTETNAPVGFYFVNTPSVSSDSNGAVVYSFQNVEERKTQIAVRKVWAGGGADHSGETVTYMLQRTGYNAAGNEVRPAADYDGPFTLTAGNSWQQQHDDLPADNNTWPDDPDYERYEYTVVETAPSGYTVDYYNLVENGETVRVIRNTPSSTSNSAFVQVQKAWTDGSGSPLTSGIPEGAYITGTLVRDYTGPRTVTVTVDGRALEWNNNGNHTSYTVDDIPPDIQVPVGATLHVWVGSEHGNQHQLHEITYDNSTAYVRLNGTNPVNNLQRGNQSRRLTNAENSSAELQEWYTTTAINENSTLYIYFGYYGHGVAFYYETTGGDTNGDSGTNEEVGPFRLDAANGWTYAWNDLDEIATRTYTYRITNVKEYNSDGTLVDTRYDGFDPPVLPINATLTKDANNHWNGTITNVKRTSVQIVKIDETTRQTSSPITLSGAQFRLLKLNGSNEYEAYDEHSYGVAEGVLVGSNGTLTFADLPDGQYKIVETRLPDGYIRASNNDIYFDIVNGNVQRYNKGVGETGREPIGTNSVVSAVSYETSQDEAVFTVGNNPGVALPSTGGPGTALCYLIGSALIAMAGAILLLRRRQRD